MINSSNHKKISGTAKNRVSGVFSSRQYRTKIARKVRSQIFRQIVPKFCRHTGVCQEILVQDDGNRCKRFACKGVSRSLCGVALITAVVLASVTLVSIPYNAAAENETVIVLSEAAENITIPEIVKKAKPSVVGISSRFDEASAGTGTGIIMSQDGYIVTNAHVVRGGPEGKNTDAEEVTVVLPDKSEYSAEIVGADSRTDLAVIKINAGEKILPAAEFGDSERLSEGELAVAIGNPLGFELYGSVTCGIISALNRTITIDEYTMTLIQTDAAINPGNSGGPLLNSCGQVIGINSSKIISDYAEGLGFAIPISSAKPIIDELIANGSISGRPQIGIVGEDISSETAAKYGLPEGVLVKFVEKDSAADIGKIRSGDIIIEAGGEPVKTLSDLNSVKEKYCSGDKLALKLYRAGRSIEIKIVLGEEKSGK